MADIIWDASNLKEVVFEGCNLKDAHFKACNFDGVTFINVDFSDFEVSKLKLKDQVIDGNEAFITALSLNR
jgi:uncharacterized protein YjbI with pentapeptide repeats